MAAKLAANSADEGASCRTTTTGPRPMTCTYARKWIPPDGLRHA